MQIRTRSCEPDRKKCSNCGKMTLYSNGYTVANFVHTPMHGKPCVIKFQRQRWHCSACGKNEQAANPKFLEVINQHRFSAPLTQFLNNLCLDRKLVDLREDTGLSSTTIKRYSDARIDYFDKNLKFPVPVMLGLDEVKIGGQFRTTITNLERRTLVELLKDRKGEYLKQKLADMWSDPERETVLFACTDMYRPFENPLKELFPNAKWVIDKWHVVKEANLSLEELRKVVQADPTFNAHFNALALKKTVRWLLLKRRHNLVGDDLKFVMTYLKIFSPGLFVAYGLKEEFFNIYENGAKEEAWYAFEAWRKSIPSDSFFEPFRKNAETFINHKEAILNHWDSKGLTNAYTECKNNLIRVTDRGGRGYSFKTLRGRVLYNSKALVHGTFLHHCFGAGLSALPENSKPDNGNNPTSSNFDEDAQANPRLYFRGPQDETDDDDDDGDS